MSLNKNKRGKYLSITFDGTSRLGEVLAIVLRYVHQWNVHQRLVRLEFLAKTMTGEEVAHQLISTLSVTYGIESSFILPAMRDGASVNGVAMDVVKIVYPDIMDVHYFSHTLDLVGDKFKTPILASFCSYWISLFHIALRLKYFGRIKLVSLWPLIAKHDGGASGKYSTKSCYSLVTLSRF